MSSEKLETLTNRIRRLRFDNGEMTQQALAEKISVTRQTIIALEAGKSASPSGARNCYSKKHHRRSLFHLHRLNCIDCLKSGFHTAHVPQELCCLLQ